MAKGLRASTERTNRRKLRANVFGPVEKARAERLHAKLLATINSEKPARPEKKEMDVDEEATEAKADLSKDMDVDDKTSTKKPHRKQSEKKTKKERARKPKNSITFPTSRGKGALKPFTGKSRVSKRK
ncbi:hypothetical protein E8E12_004471 [Didymella heteroderae]|uniref:DUF2423 domain-containing protein n=1 Tax=Didymella heteroderae TaxID=1769908 RepID=A0A9P4WUY1_9PLEO|nr:hypothetical protein E8E12_004471 [Didymella heteroderae]